MDIRLSPFQEEWRAIAQELAETVLAPNASEIDRESRFPKENLRALGRAGLLGLSVPEELGGPGADVVTTTAVTEALALGCSSTAMCYHMHNTAAWLISSLAEGDQVDRYVVPILGGEYLSTYALSEPTSGSRWWHMEGFATRSGDEYVLDAYKSFATSAGHVDSYVVPIRASPESAPNELSLFVVDAATENVKPIGVWNGMGMRGNSSVPVHFDKCRVPSHSRIGEPGLGFPLLLAYGLPIFQVGLAAVYVGIAEAALLFAISYATKRVHADTGKPLAQVETIQHYVAEMKLRIDQARLFTIEFARRIDAARGDMLEAVNNKEFLLSLAEVKLTACRMAIDVSNIALQVCGGTGYSRNHPVERYYRDARAGSIMGPNDDALSLLMGQRVLGLPFPWEK
jgi:alkylation response protein AidB-like acyl-CoA dehydrogenase